jgi:hypothetical protein
MMKPKSTKIKTQTIIIHRATSNTLTKEHLSYIVFSVFTREGDREKDANR